MSTLETRIGISAADYDATLAFYRDAVGLAVEKSWDRGGVDYGTLFRAGAAFLEVLPHAHVVEVLRAEGTPRGSTVWIYLEVENVDVSHERLRAHGVPILMPPTDEPWGHRRLRTCDPDGIPVGLFSRTSPGSR